MLRLECPISLLYGYHPKIAILNSWVKELFWYVVNTQAFTPIGYWRKNWFWFYVSENEIPMNEAFFGQFII